MATTRAIAIMALWTGLGCSNVGESGPGPGDPTDAGTASDAARGSGADADPGDPDLGPSGLDSARPLADLSATERTQLCQWQIDLHGGEGHAIDCGDDGDIVVGTVLECVDRVPRFIACELRVAELEGCALEFAAMPCDVTIGGACDPLFQCPAD